jgi:hypothetical protein
VVMAGAVVGNEVSVVMQHRKQNSAALVAWGERNSLQERYMFAPTGQGRYSRSWGVFLVSIIIHQLNPFPARRHPNTPQLVHWDLAGSQRPADREGERRSHRRPPIRSSSERAYRPK